MPLNCDKAKEYFLRYYLLLITNFLCLNTAYLPPFSFLFSFSYYVEEAQWYQKTLNNPQLRGLRNKLHRVKTINLKREN